MGIERDYLMRQLMMLLEVIQKIINFRKQGKLQEAKDQVNFFYNYLKLEIVPRDMTIEDLLEYLTHKKNFTNDHIEMIAYVLKEQGELSQDEKQKLDYFRKAYFLLEKTDRESTSFSMERQLILAELRSSLN